MRILPSTLISTEVLDALTALLLEKEALRRALRVQRLGPRVEDPELARRRFRRIIGITHELLNLDGVHVDEPRLQLTHRLRHLPRQVLNLCFFLFPIAFFFIYLDLHHEETAPATWLARLAVFSLLIIPLLVYRRGKLNIEHDCSYVRDASGQTITIDQLHSVQFDSYVAHEYAHHLYFELFDRKKEHWIREGWARLAQWEVVHRLYRSEKNPTYLYYTLDQVVGELKFACEIISMVLGRKLPKEVQRIQTMYKMNPLLRHLTGTPGFDIYELLDHAIGTASYFLAGHCLGSEKALCQPASIEEQLTRLKEEGLEKCRFIKM